MSEHKPTAEQLIGSVLSLIGEDIRVAAAIDIETAIKLRTAVLHDALKEIAAAAEKRSLSREWVKDRVYLALAGVPNGR